jgi:hypothetical protein
VAVSGTALGDYYGKPELRELSRLSRDALESPRSMIRFECPIGTVSTRWAESARGGEELGVLRRPILESGGFEVANFRPNSAFSDFMHEEIATEVLADEAARRRASGMRNGFLYILDGRVPYPCGEESRAHVIGWLRVRDGELVVGGYERNPEHRLLSVHGFPALPDGLERAVERALLERATTVEQESVLSVLLDDSAT